ncbi:5'-nucleotidase, lipoprotein e(P4) family [Saccharicrinis sp. FJH62]|uniref:5'-nucleotidase, lipoprotein e(P4) family n=1 Tax=Saccharicrinis sp. FJH62 TaxID=3344657 RepID=UPI0035D3E0D4
MKLTNSIIFILGFTTFAGLSSCQIGSDGNSGSFPTANENLNATLWMQTSAEYNMLCQQTYKFAFLNLELALQDKTWTAALEQTKDFSDLPPAIIVDIDETILDNSPFQARLIKHHQAYSDELWKEWVLEEKAEPIPGAKEFLEKVQSHGVKIFFVTNRVLQDPTVENLKKEVSPDITADDVLCKNEQPDWGSDKTSRRALIAQSYRILLLIGDDYNDFTYLGKPDPNERKQMALKQIAHWGKEWFVLPNPTYGSFDKALWNYDYSKTDQEKIKSKYQYLNTKE